MEHEPSSLSHQPYKLLLGGAVVAIVAAFVGIVPRIGAVDTWKIVLGVAGLALFIVAGREPRKS
jgi:hypothetical protein